MVVLMLESTPTSLRGELTRWLLEVNTGVFVGRVSALVRDLLWDKCVEHKKSGRCYLAYRTNNEQGFSVRTAGDSERTIVNLDGLQLVAVKNAAWEKMFVESGQASPKEIDNLAEHLDTSN